MRDQAGDALLAKPADVPRSVERVKACHGYGRHVADVVEPGGGEEAARSSSVLRA
jgi:hypothetical protein